MIEEFIAEYGSTIIYTILTALIGAIGIIIKNIYQKFANDRTKKAVVKTCVLAVEQLYKNLDGSSKYEKCVTAITEMLNEKGILITDLEIKMLIESAVGELNDIFNKEVLEEKGLVELSESGGVEDVYNSNDKTGE